MLEFRSLEYSNRIWESEEFSLFSGSRLDLFCNLGSFLHQVVSYLKFDVSGYWKMNVFPAEAPPRLREQVHRDLSHAYCRPRTRRLRSPQYNCLCESWKGSHLFPRLRTADYCELGRNGGLRDCSLCRVIDSEVLSMERPSSSLRLSIRLETGVRMVIIEKLFSGLVPDAVCERKEENGHTYYGNRTQGQIGGSF